jgi:hypothetical protein
MSQILIHIAVRYSTIKVVLPEFNNVDIPDCGNLEIQRLDGLKWQENLLSFLKMYDYFFFQIYSSVLHTHTRLRWPRGCVLASSTQVREFKPDRRNLIFQGEKIPSTPSFGVEVKPAVPCRRFAACKRTLNDTWKSAFRQNSRLLFLAH